MSKKFNVAVVGATGAVGQTMIEILEQRNFPVENLYPLASSRSAGQRIKFHNQSIVVQVANHVEIDHGHCLVERK